MSHDLSLLLLTLTTWPRSCLSHFSTRQVFFFLSGLHSLEANHYIEPIPKQWRPIHHLHEGRVATLIVLRRRFLSFLPFIYLFNSLFISWWTHRRLFYKRILLYLFCCSNCSSFGHWEFFPLEPVFHKLPSACVCVCVWWVLSTSLLFDTTRCSNLILHTFCSVLESAVSLRSPCSFYWRTVLRTNTLLLERFCF